MSFSLARAAAFAVLGTVVVAGFASNILLADSPVRSTGPDAFTRSANTPASLPVLGLAGRMSVGRLPSYMAEDLANGWMYVANEGSGTVTVLDGTHVVANVSVGAGASGLAYDPQSEFVYVADSGSDQVSILVGTTLVDTVEVGRSPCAPVYDSADGWVYVPNTGSASVTIFNGTTIVATAPVGSDPIDATYDPANGTVYVTNQMSNFENILSGNATIDLVPTNLIEPFTTVYDPENGWLYVTNITPNDGILSDVSVLNGTDRLATFSVGPGPGYMAVNASSGEVYLPSIGLDAVQILNGTSIVNTILVGGDPTAAAYDPADGLVFVADDLTNDVTVLGTSRVLSDISVGENPSWVTFDSTDSYVYVAARGGGETDAIGLVPGYAVNFSESGLPGGSVWSVTMKQVSSVSNTSYDLTFLPNGTYGFQIGTGPGYTPHPATGSFNVTGNPIDLLVAFSTPAKPAGPGFLGLPNPIGAVLLGTGIAAIVGVTTWRLLVWRHRRRERLLRV
jgi:YVTN family beta-propeller protein